MDLKHSDITGNILKAFFNVAKAIPFGFDINFYKNALKIELENLELSAKIDQKIEVKYLNQKIGDLHSHLIVNDLVAVKITSEGIQVDKKSKLEMKNLLKFSKYEVGLILNFGEETAYKRILLTEDYK